MKAAGHGGTFSVLSLLISLSLLRSHGDHGWLFMLLLLCLLLELCKGAQEFDFSSLTPNRYFLRVFLKQMNSSASAFYTLKKTKKTRFSYRSAITLIYYYLQDMNGYSCSAFHQPSVATIVYMGLCSFITEFLYKLACLTT